MVVDNFHSMGVSVPPLKTDPVPVVDPNAVLPHSVLLKCLESVTRKNPKIIQPSSGVELQQLALCHPGDAPEPAGRETEQQSLGVSAPEGPDHSLRVLRYA